MAEDADIRTGRCLCGAVRFTVRGSPRFLSACHCETCRRASSAPVAAWAGFRDEQVSFEGEAPRTYASSPGVTRSFCGTCGSPIAYRGERWPGETHLTICSFASPQDMAPDADFMIAEKLPWSKPLSQPT